MRNSFRTPTLDECIQISYCHRDKEENLRYWKYRLEHDNDGSMLFHNNFKFVDDGLVIYFGLDDCSSDMFDEAGERYCKNGADMDYIEDDFWLFYGIDCEFTLVSGGVIIDYEPDDCSWDMYEGLEENE